MMTLSQLQAKELAGKCWPLNGETLTFADYDRDAPGQPPWKTGAEGIAYPLLNGNGQPAAYVKFFDALKMTSKRMRRTKWLIDQRLDEWSQELRGAPQSWLETKTVGTPDGVNFEFTCSFADAVPGQTWLELKLDVMDGVIALDEEFRRRCVENLLRGLVHVERNDFVHGDLSPNNVIIDAHSPPNSPALYLIDFDAFFARPAGDLASLSAGEGGTFGTQGYCPSELEQLAQQDPLRAAPFSDRFARDMLLMEILCFDKDCDFEAPPVQWDRNAMISRLTSSRLGRSLTHLQNEDVFHLSENQRPSSEDLARDIKLVMPPHRKSFCPTAHSETLRREISDRERLQRAEDWLRKAIGALFLLCVIHVALVAFWLTGRLIGNESILATFARFFLTAAMCLGAIAGLFVLAFAEDEPRHIPLARFWIRVPARRSRAENELAQLGRVANGLLLILVALGGSAILLARN